MIRVLLVEDDAKFARRMQLLLEGFGFVADVAVRANEALDMARGDRYRAVLLDWGLPDGQGPDVIRHMRSSGISTPVIMLTGRSSVPDRVRALQAGADDYLVKPVDVRELAARVQAVMRRSDGESPYEALSCGRITAHLEAHEVWVDGARVNLSFLEFKLLVFLMRSCDEALGRAEILAAVWGAHNDPGSNVVDVHVGRLRDKLGLARAQLETVRGIGYRLRAGAPEP